MPRIQQRFLLQPVIGVSAAAPRRVRILLDRHEATDLLERIEAEGRREWSRARVSRCMRRRFAARWEAFQASLPPDVQLEEPCWLSASALATVTPSAYDRLLNSNPSEDAWIGQHFLPDGKDPALSAAGWSLDSVDVGSPMQVSQPPSPRQLVGAENLRFDGSGTRIAILDGGVSPHDDFARPGTRRSAASRRLEPIHLIPDSALSPGLVDPGHGTSVASLAAGLRVGIARGAEILPIVVNQDPAVMCRGLVQCLLHRVDVVCLAGGCYRWFRHNDPAWWRRLCETLLALGVLHAVAAGNGGHQINDNQQPPQQVATPADCPPPRRPLARASSAIACGAFGLESATRPVDDCSRGPSEWSAQRNTLPYTDYPESHRLPKPDLYAPGAIPPACLEELGHRHVPASTSGAAGVTAGCLALLAQAAKEAGRPVAPEEIFEALAATAQPWKTPVTAGYAEACGQRIRVDHAYEYGERRGWWGRRRSPPRPTQPCASESATR